MSALPNPYLTPADYLAQERTAAHKSEYWDGVALAMVGASQTHNRIVTNLVRLLGNHLLERDCTVYANDLRVRSGAGTRYVYPDVVVACEPEEYEDSELDTLLNPRLIIEVLSDSTERYDRGRKFELYQTIPSLVEYLLVSQEPYSVEQYAREDETLWSYRAYHGPEDELALRSLDYTLLLREVYHKVAELD